VSKAWASQSPSNVREWRRIRKLILERDLYRCQLKMDGVCKTVATQVHHTIGISVSGNDPAYLVSACGPCNQKVGDPRKLDPVPLSRYDL
jgi:5-methylcytosine-specific restriction endonuclease McrA